MKIDKAVTHVPATAAETPTQLPLAVSDLPLVVNAASTVGTPTQLPLAVSDPPTVVNAASTVGTPAQLPLPPTVVNAALTVGTVGTPINVLAASTGGMTGMADVQTQITTGQLLGTVLVADTQVHLQPLHLQPLQTPLQGGDGISAGAHLFPPYYKSTGEDWNGMSGENDFPFGVQGFNDGYLGHFGSGYNMLTGPAQEAWLSAQNLGGRAGLETNNWNFGTDLSTLETNMPRPTYHPLPMQELDVGSNIEQLEQLGT